MPRITVSVEGIATASATAGAAKINSVFALLYTMLFSAHKAGFSESTESCERFVQPVKILPIAVRLLGNVTFVSFVHWLKAFRSMFVSCVHAEKSTSSMFSHFKKAVCPIFVRFAGRASFPDMPSHLLKAPLPL